MMLAELEGDRQSRWVEGSELYRSGVIYPGLLSYSYNVLMSVEDNGVLFVQGIPTTVPLFGSEKLTP